MQHGSVPADNTFAGAITTRTATISGGHHIPERRGNGRPNARRRARSCRSTRIINQPITAGIKKTGNSSNSDKGNLFRGEMGDQKQVSQVQWVRPPDRHIFDGR